MGMDHEGGVRTSQSSLPAMWRSERLLASAPFASSNAADEASEQDQDRHPDVANDELEGVGNACIGSNREPENVQPCHRDDRSYDGGHRQGQPVIALTETEATILAPSGANLTYCRHNKRAPGLIGGSTDGGGVVP